MKTKKIPPTSDFNFHIGLHAVLVLALIVSNTGSQFADGAIVGIVFFRSITAIGLLFPNFKMDISDIYMKGGNYFPRVILRSVIIIAMMAIIGDTLLAVSYLVSECVIDATLFENYKEHKKRGKING